MSIHGAPDVGQAGPGHQGCSVERVSTQVEQGGNHKAAPPPREVSGVPQTRRRDPVPRPSTQRSAERVPAGCRPAGRGCYCEERQMRDEAEPRGGVGRALGQRRDTASHRDRTKKTCFKGSYRGDRRPLLGRKQNEGKLAGDMVQRGARVPGGTVTGETARS